MEKIKLLVFVDDDYATNFYHKVIVRDSGLVENYLFFSEPEKALEYFTDLNNQENPIIPDAIFLDINMPKLKGLDFLRTLANPPIIIITSAYRDYALEGFELNVLDYLVKPIPFPRLVKAMDKFL